MSEPLTKSQLCWVIIRVSGVYLIFQAAFSLILGVVTWLMTESSFPTSFAVLRAETIGAFVFLILIGVGVPLFVGNYLLTNGSKVHGWLMREQRGREGRKAPASEEGIDPKTLLTWGETAAFDEWLLRNPQYGGRELTDQIALFRDAQRKMKEGREGGGE